MNPETNKFEELFTDDERSKGSQSEALEKAYAQEADKFIKRSSERKLLRADGTPVPEHWKVFRVGENYVINDYTFRCAYIGETSILFEPVAPVILQGLKERIV